MSLFRPISSLLNGDKNTTPPPGTERSHLWPFISSGWSTRRLQFKGFTQKAIALFGCLCACLFIQLSEDHKLLKLGDFGLARATEGTRQTKTLIGSWRYMAPEVMSLGGHYSKKADVYSFGELNKVFSVRVLMVPDGSSCFKIYFLHHFHIDYNALCLPPKVLHSHCLRSLSGLLQYPSENGNNGNEKLRN